tara:strand:- start:1852 stop:2154 length:303 start_codon:yes stop_codon:yes gene_type:complete
MARGKNFSADEINTMIKMLGKGCSIDEIAEVLGRQVAPTRVRINRLRSQVGVVIPKAEKLTPVVVDQLEEVNDGNGTINFVVGLIVGALISGVVTFVVLM